ncbi:MAG: ABC transporter substrate-binding protein [Clostridiales bacterium]|nr:ABC transporter substrate-binding protein [Clostridiales bacterium]
MKKISKVFSLAIMLVMALLLVTGCGKDSADDNNKQESQGGENLGEFDDEFVIGGFGPITGEAAQYGSAVMNSSKIAVDEINEAGGVKVGDKTLKLVHTFEDDEASPDVAQAAYNKLMDDGVQAIVGGVTSGSHMGVVDLANEDNILMVSPSVTVDNGVETPNAFRTCFTDSMQGEIMAEYALSVGAKKIAVIYNQADEYSTGIMQVFVDAIDASDAEIVANEGFEAGATDMKTQLTTIRNSGADIIFAPVYYQAASYITQQANELGMDIPFIGTDGWDGILEVTVDPAILEGAVFQTPFTYNDPNPAVQEYAKKYEELTGEKPNQFGANAYDAVYVVKEALEKAGTVESEDLIAIMQEIEVDGITGKISFDENGEPQKEVKLIRIVDGEYELFSLE